MNKPRLILLRSGQPFPEKDQTAGPVSWLFLSQDYARLVALRAIQPDGFDQIDIGEELNKTTTRLRRLYIDYIGSLSVINNSLAWWSSRVAEKNVMASPVFLYICYLEVIRQLVNGSLKGKDLCVFSASPALLETLRREPLFRSYRIIKCYHYRYWLSGAVIKAILRLGIFIWRSIRKKLAATVTRHLAKGRGPAGKGPLVIMRTWVSDSNLRSDGMFTDQYFKDLREHLSPVFPNIVILPILYNIKRSIGGGMTWFRSSQQNFLIPEDYYRLADYLSAIMTSCSTLRLFSRSYEFMGHDLSLLFSEDALRQSFDDLSLSLIMHYFLMKRLRRKGMNIDRIIITFENMFSEKPLILGAKKFLPGTKVLGFQHASLFPLLLCCYTSAVESKVLPMPDKIICSGRFFEKIMGQEGFPVNKLVPGPALRFQYLLGAMPTGAAGEAKNVILVTSPLARPAALELLLKIAESIKDRPQYRFWLKPHPMMQGAEFRELIEKTGLSQRSFEIIGGNMADALSRVKVLIAAASAAIFDAVAAGVPVIRVRSNVDLSLDPMDWFPVDELHFTARTPDEIGREIDRAMALDKKQLTALADRGRQLIEMCFSPINEQTLMPFMVK